eukprot:3148422-Rhodomonas_salina.1
MATVRDEEVAVSRHSLARVDDRRQLHVSSHARADPVWPVSRHPACSGVDRGRLEARIRHDESALRRCRGWGCGSVACRRPRAGIAWACTMLCQRRAWHEGICPCVCVCVNVSSKNIDITV